VPSAGKFSRLILTGQRGSLAAISPLRKSIVTRRIAYMLTSIALLVCAPAFAQSASIPDLSGIWGRNYMFFEPPPSGPGPIVSKLRRPNGTLVGNPMIGDYNNPIPRPYAAEVVKKHGEMQVLAGNPNPHNQCWLQPTPFVLNTQMGIQLIQQKDKVVLLYISDHQVRQVRLNVPHSEHPAPTWQGESVGYYEGDTLVIDTIGQKVGPLSMVDMYGTPFSAALHVIERYRLIDGATARDLQLKHESTYFGAGRSSPLLNEYGRGEIDPDAIEAGFAGRDHGRRSNNFHHAVVGIHHLPPCARRTAGIGLRREYAGSWMGQTPTASREVRFLSEALTPVVR
jgi:hypothetical protein